jgi:anthranilate synthase/aminodeoxychorismate synthase-like glutamine amidotransferase
VTANILLIDNYDSFTYNLVQAFRVLGADVTVLRNDGISLAEALTLEATHLVISPGPGEPLAAGISVGLIRASAGKLPILGVCLGHQAIVAAFGGRIVHAHRLMHGKTSVISHDSGGVFTGIDNPVEVGRYHSLTAEPASLPDNLAVTAHTDQGEVMGVRDSALGIEGVQFHPESVLTPQGPAMMANFLAMTTAAPAKEADSVRVS